MTARSVLTLAAALLLCTTSEALRVTSALSPSVRVPAASAAPRACGDIIMREGPSAKKSSLLTVSAEEKANKAEKRDQITRGLPLAVILAFALNALTGGAAFNVEVAPTANVRGLSEARALKAKSEERSKAFYENLRSGGPTSE